jgi:ferredoxin
MTADRWHIEVDRTVCIGSGMCFAAAPEGFKLDAARQSNPVEPDATAAESLLAAAEGCPVEAITITLLGTGQPVFPPQE